MAMIDRWHTVFLGAANAYLIEGTGGCVLVDGGPGCSARLFSRFLRKHRIAPHRIRLLVVTHAHFDHVGGGKRIRDLCQCPVGMHPEDAEVARRGDMVFPPGTSCFGKIASRVGRLLAGPLVRYEAIDADLRISREIDLKPYGVEGKVIPTPGHTLGSLSVLLPDGTCFIGDTASNIFPGRHGPYLPPFAHNVDQLLHSWEILLKRGATLICPGHGRPFKAELLLQEKHHLRR